MPDQPSGPKAEADTTAVRVALWRALHVRADPPPHVLVDEVGLKLAAPEEGWQDRPDMSPFTRPFRASIVARGRFIEDLVAERTADGVGQYVAMSFLLPLELADPEVRPGLERAAEGARASGTPFISFFTPEEMLTLAREAGFADVQHVSAAVLARRYFAGRTDGLRPPNNSEELLVANT